MNLNAYAADLRLRLFDELKSGLPPSVGTYDAEVLREAKTKDSPQLGSTHYTPDLIQLEFIYPDPRSTATVLTVSVPAPERIVFMPVPSWVVETIWQGDVDGSYQFESDAQRLLAEFTAELSAEGNAKWFGPRAAKRRE